MKISQFEFHATSKKKLLKDEVLHDYNDCNVRNNKGIPLNV